MTVRRALPRHGRRTVGAWCFVDHFGPGPAAVEIGPHPHIGLQTVTWLVTGEVVHRDSLGSEQAIRPGRLNLMTAGRGVTHSEESPAHARGIHGVQLWIAQPDGTRNGEPAFEHHAELPHAPLGKGIATVLVGTFAGERSPARTDTPLVGCDIALSPGTTQVPLDPAFEYALVVLEGAVSIGPHVVRPGSLGYLGRDREWLDLSAPVPARTLLLGGEPFDEPLLMWWNFVARTRAEIDEAADAWQAGAARFGDVDSVLARIAAPPRPWPARR